MPERLARFGRLQRVMQDRERLLQEEAQRSLAACRQVELALQALQPPAPPPDGATAAARAHRERHAACVEGQRADLQERLGEARAEAHAANLRARQAAQTRRALERLVGRLTDRQRTWLQRQEQDLTDEHAQRPTLE